MKTLDKGQEKIEKICEILRKETLEPAEKKAEEIIADANTKAEEIVRQAERRVEELMEKARLAIEQERGVFQSSLTQAARQGVEMLRQEIEQRLFNPELEKLIVSSAGAPKTVAALINALIGAIEKQGLTSELIAYIPKDISPQMVNSELLASVVKRLQSGAVTVGEFKTGAEVKLIDKKMKIEMNEDSLKELLAQFMRKDFRKFIFNQ